MTAGQSNTLDAQVIREGLIETIPPDAAEYGGDLPKLPLLYLPESHLRALSPDCSLVVGIRGSGKSLWRAALADAAARNLISEADRRSGISTQTSVTTGFSDTENNQEYPSQDTVRKLLEDKIAPRYIWLAVILHQLKCPGISSLRRWSERSLWVKDWPEECSEQIDQAEADLRAKGGIHLILFDALDRISTMRQDLPIMLRGLLEVTLQFRSRTAIRLKLFLRPDMLEESEVMGFPDASKLKAAQTELRWSRLDLYGLLWQRLGNSDAAGNMFREFTNARFHVSWAEAPAGRFAVPRELAFNSETQRAAFEAISGKWMGSGPRRGATYTWLPNHLVDTRDQVSPRSFLKAIRTAAEQGSAGACALHFDGLKRGVQEASKIRIDEMAEDFPWVQKILEPLAGEMLIPALEDDFLQIWKRKSICSNLLKDKERARETPPSLELGERGFLADLQRLGILSALPDKRLQMPDVYRVAFRLGRKGGIKPLR